MVVLASNVFGVALPSTRVDAGMINGYVSLFLSLFFAHDSDGDGLARVGGQFGRPVTALSTYQVAALTSMRLFGTSRDRFCQ